MRNGRDPVGRHQRLQPFIRFAIGEGWTVFRSGAGQLSFRKAGLPPIHAGSGAPGSSTGAATKPRAERRANPRERGASDG